MQPKLSKKLKIKFYKTNLRPTMLYQSHCSTVNKQYIQNMSATEIKILGWMSENIVRMIRNECVDRKLDVTPTEDKGENLLRWFEHV